MDYRPNEYQVTVSWAVPLCIKPVRDPQTRDGFRGAGDIDAELSVRYWDAGADDHDWEVYQAEITQEGDESFTVSKASDPQGWALLMRGIERDREALHETIVERIREVEGQ